ncbi:anti-sigma regulatory factor [Acaryochloris sp. IP29b_bin.148]|uniref:ATP-binding protein n=1 Tax=Acaryochloris sp. IP29b_bin.148 TaxID=2969218 RepID=UPI002610EF5F|nr:anti-sigma regulatory factor [Acaryochloris sp. IP29b_bin.148]
MIAPSLPPKAHRWQQVSFASTLYLCPILDCLLADVPIKDEAALRLGLQEALVNAAKHGNKLDPYKTIFVHFSVSQSQCWWIITDQGAGFTPPDYCQIPPPPQAMPEAGCECGRGLYILHHVFDQVYWNSDGTELRLYKAIKSSAHDRLALQC